MTDIRDWANEADLNGEASPAGWPEGMPPSDVNNSAREMMAALRRSYVRQPWYAPGGEIVRVSGTQITIKDDAKVTNYSQFYSINQRVRIEGEEYNVTGFVSSISYEEPTTTIEFETDAELPLPGTIKDVYVGLSPSDVQGVAGPNLLGCIIGFTEEASQLGAGLLHANGEKFSPSLYADLAKLYFMGNDVDGTPNYRYGREKVGDEWWPKRPDVRGYFPRFLDDRQAPGEGEEDTRVDPSSPRVVGSTQGDAIRNVAGLFTSGDESQGQGTGPFRRTNDILGATGTRNTDTVPGYSFDLSRSTPTSSENRPKNIAVVGVIVAYGGVIAGGLADVSELVDAMDTIKRDLATTKMVVEETSATVSELGDVMRYKGSVDTYDNLPTENEIGDVYNVLDTGVNYAWTAEGAWDEFGGGAAKWGSIEGDITAQADLQEALSKKLENTSTYTNSFSVGTGAVTQSTSATSLGVSSSSKGSATAVGYQANAAATGSVAVGRESHAQDSYSVAVGYQAKTPGGYSIAVGTSSEAGDSAVALGSGARALAEDSIQIGVGTNEEEGSLKVLDKKLLDAKGHIPPDRLLRTPASLTLNAKQKEIAEEFGVYFAENSVDASLIQDGHFFDSDEGLLKAAVTRYDWETKINPYYNYSSMSWSVLKFKNKLYAFGDSFRNGTYYCELWTSDDGKTWTRNTNVTDLKSIVVASDSAMVCVTNTGGLKRSEDGETWIDVESFTGTNVSALWYGGGVFLAKGASNSLYVSTDGSVWDSVALVDTDGSALSNFDGISFDGTKFIMYASYGNLYTSSDGVNWTKNTSLSRVDFVEYKDGIYVAGKQKTSGATQMYYSTDLNEWTPTSVVKGWGNYASFVVGDYYLIVSQASTEDYMYVSKDGLNWIELEYPKGYYRSPFAYVDGVYYTTAYKPDSTSYGLLGRSEIADAKATFSTVICSLEDIAVAGDNIKFTAATKKNYSVVGTPTIENNVASDFGNSDGLTTENPFVAEECTRVEMVLVFEMPTLISKPLIANEIPTEAPYFRVNVTAEGLLNIQYTDTAGQVKRFSGPLGITANTKIWYKCIGDVSTGLFYQYKSTDEGNTWSSMPLLSGFTSPSLETGSLLYWGKYGRAAAYFTGKIYLEDCYIKTTSASGEKTLKLVEPTGKTEVSAPLTGYLKNEATYAYSIAIGPDATDTSSHGVSIGASAAVAGRYATAVGYTAKCNADNSVAIGRGATVTTSGPKAIAIGYNANAYTENSIQLGVGENSVPNTMNVGLSDTLNVQLLDASGQIPGGRMSLQGTTAPDTTTVGSIGQFYVDTATGTGYLCVGVADGVYTWKQITS